MDKDFLKGIKFSLGIIFIFSILFSVFAVGFHLAEEILPGTFTGNYIFDGNITVNGEYKGKNVATAWVNFDGTDCPSNSCSIRDSYNVYNVTKIGIGVYEIYFIESMLNSNYAISGYSRMDGLVYGDSSNLASINNFKIRTVVGHSNAVFDSSFVNLVVYGGKN